ncbi:uncharacterized protein LOC117182586 [Belonocnema kinseyi]|uniref:uncharacterized protein LOC117182586 n=1 Tax=Belonocnema kinseyi TaxID=2817044 RepID=UPI00143D55C9|nr:uncharacterized protein LOC117182586 [Belonocnema kinseyi]
MAGGSSRRPAGVLPEFAGEIRQIAVVSYCNFIGYCFAGVCRRPEGSKQYSGVYKTGVKHPKTAIVSVDQILNFDSTRTKEKDFFVKCGDDHCLAAVRITGDTKNELIEILKKKRLTFPPNHLMRVPSYLSTPANMLGQKKTCHILECRNSLAN